MVSCALMGIEVGEGTVGESGCRVSVWSSSEGEVIGG